MPAPIIIEVTPQARAVIAKLQRFPVEMGQAIKRGMDEAGNIAWKDITVKRFSGKGPFPVAMHKLGSRTERLKQSLIYRAAKIETAGQSVSVTGALGSEGVWYFPLHEFGGTVTIKPFFRKNRKSTKKKPRPQVAVKAHSRTYPARAPMRHGIEDHRITFQKKIQEQLEAEWAKK